MDASVEEARRKLAALRAGRANVDMVADLRVSAWGSDLPLSQVAQIGAQPPRGLVVTPHDPSLMAAVERAIADSDLGARPRVDGQRIRIEVPASTDERRTQLARQAKEVAEQARVAVRLARRDAVNELKRSRAADVISDAQLHGRSKDLQLWTDERIAQVDELLATALAAIAE